MGTTYHLPLLLLLLLLLPLRLRLRLLLQMREWDETSECPGQCEQRHFLTDKRGPPLTPVTLEGSGEPCEKCPCGQKCLYRFTDASDNFVKGSHITPVIRYVDDIILEKLGETVDGCQVHGHSFSTGPAYYDFTTNYCNMRNLMTGTGMSELQGYREDSSTDLCMQYDKIEAFGNCNKY